MIGNCRSLDYNRLWISKRFLDLLSDREISLMVSVDVKHHVYLLIGKPPQSFDYNRLWISNIFLDLLSDRETAAVSTTIDSGSPVYFWILSP